MLAECSWGISGFGFPSDFPLLNSFFRSHPLAAVPGAPGDVQFSGEDTVRRRAFGVEGSQTAGIKPLVGISDCVVVQSNTSLPIFLNFDPGGIGWF